MTKETLEQRLASLRLATPDATLRTRVLTSSPREARKRRYSNLAVQIALSVLLGTLIWAHFKENDTMERLATLEAKENAVLQLPPAYNGSLMARLMFLPNFPMSFLDESRSPFLIEQNVSSTPNKTGEHSSL